MRLRRMVLQGSHRRSIPLKSGRGTLEQPSLKFATYRCAGVTPPYSQEAPWGGSGLLRRAGGRRREEEKCAMLCARTDAERVRNPCFELRTPSVETRLVTPFLPKAALPVQAYQSRSRALSANVRETRSTQRIRVGRRQRKRTCWDCEREWKRMVVPLEPGRPSEARQLLRTRR